MDIQSGRSRILDRIYGGLTFLFAFVFLALYAAAFAGKLDPLANNTLLLKFEPVIFILLGFSFAWIPWRSVEGLLGREIDKLNSKVETANAALTAAIEERDALRERVRVARLVFPKEAGADSSISRILDD